MPIFTFDPTTDDRWDEFVETHPRASVFHRTGWLRALADTYNYRPLVATTSPPGQPLSNGIPFCEIRSLITGRRAVSLPFADHADLLLGDGGSLGPFLEWAKEETLRRRWKYLELRPAGFGFPLGEILGGGAEFWLHVLDLRPSVDDLFRNLHKSSLQRRIKKAEQIGLEYERGCYGKLIDEFFCLQVITRRRHQLLPQPFAWFRNIIARLNGRADIRVLRKDGVPIASILALYHGKKAVYKYGCSDEAQHHLGAMPLILWKLISESKSEGFEQLDFGRSEKDNEGLIRFKDQFGAERRAITYARYPRSAHKTNDVSPYLSLSGRFFSVLPDSISTGLGRAVYRHLG